MEHNNESIEKIPEITFEYSVEQEVYRVKNTLERISWFEEQGYPWRKFIYPDGVDAAAYNDKKVTYSDEDMTKLVQTEFDELLYANVANFIKEEWNKGGGFFQTKLAECHLPTVDKYKIILTRYGTGGSYHLPNKVFLNLKHMSKTEEQVFMTMLHEMIHLGIEELIRRYDLTQWQKERVVDLTLDTFSPGIKGMQKMPEGLDTNKIDQIFKSEYPNIENIIRQIGELNKK